MYLAEREAVCLYLLVLLLRACEALFQGPYTPLRRDMKHVCAACPPALILISLRISAELCEGDKYELHHSKQFHVYSI